MNASHLAIATALLAPFALVSEAHADLDFGTDCSSGSGRFVQAIVQGDTVEIGTIPVGKRRVRIELDSQADVDIQLVDVQTGHPIVAWPNGDLSGPTDACATFEGVTYCYSGYNGQFGEAGNEWIEVQGDTNRSLQMLAYGYAAGEADVTYRWEAVPTCREAGSGSFDQPIPAQGSVVVGNIPAGIVDVEVDLQTSGGRDVDVQLWDGDVPLVQWPDGLLSGPGFGSVEYEGVTIEYSGYNGIDGNWGHESIRVIGELPSTWTLRAYGYQAGTARVEYRWGMNAGATCGGVADLPCTDGYSCKHVMTDYADPTGECHTDDWCHPETAQADCQGLFHIAVPGSWGCDAFECVWLTACESDDDCTDGFCGWATDGERVCKPWAEEGETCEGFVLPAYREFCAPELTCVPSEETFDVPGTCLDLSCSMFDQACPAGFTCDFGCPSDENCGINPPGQCVED